MKFVLSAAGGSLIDVGARWEMARGLGYDGIEIDLQAVGAAGELKGAIACVDAGFFWTGVGTDSAPIRQAIAAAKQIGVPVVQLGGAKLTPGKSLSSAATAFSNWLRPMADAAGEAGVKLLVGNQGSYRTANWMWMILDRLNHPALGCAWDVASAMSVGEGSALSIPTLNSKIRMVRLAGLVMTPLFEQTIKRLRGIGFGGDVVAETTSAAEVGRLRGWIERLGVSDAEASAGVVDKKKPAAVAGLGVEKKSGGAGVSLPAPAPIA